MEYINLQTWGFINPGFKGSAFISASFWEHDVFDETGFFLRNLVGLAAVSIERTGTPLGEDVPGDEAAGSRGIPFRTSDIEDMEFEFDYEGPAKPLCPGLPDLRFREGEDGPQLLCPPDTLEGTYSQGGTWPEYDTWVTTGGRIFRDGSPTICVFPAACPGPTLGGGGNVDAYYFDNPSGNEVCVTITATHACGFNSMVIAYRGHMPNGTIPTCPVDWDGAGEKYLGDCGQSGSPQNFQFIVPDGEEHWTLVFANVFNPQVCGYTATIAGFPCQ